MTKFDKSDIAGQVDRIDIFICCSSFEDRCFVIPSAVSTLNPERCIVFYNSDFSKSIIENAEKLRLLLGSTRTIKTEISLKDASLTYATVFESLQHTLKNNRCQRVLVDITTFTHEALLIVLKVLHLIKKESQIITFLYNAADGYSINEADPHEKWLTKGILSMRSIIGYPGITDLSLKDRLIIVFGFERDRTKRIIETFDYDNITLAFGEENQSVTKAHYAINKSRHQELVEEFSNIEKLEVSLVDPAKTKAQLLAYVNSMHENIVVMPMNTKLSTLGVGLAALENKSIQLYYSLAARYNTIGYSQPSQTVYKFEI